MLVGRGCRCRRLLLDLIVWIQIRNEDQLVTGPRSVCSGHAHPRAKFDEASVLASVAEVKTCLGGTRPCFGDVLREDPMSWAFRDLTKGSRNLGPGSATLQCLDKVFGSRVV
jgi:hypothetical protein